VFHLKVQIVGYINTNKLHSSTLPMGSHQATCFGRFILPSSDLQNNIVNRGTFVNSTNGIPSGYMFRAVLSCHHQTYRIILSIKVHSLTLPMGSHCLHFKYILNLILPVKILLDIKQLYLYIYIFNFPCRGGRKYPWYHLVA